jgi:type IV pilus assembly protein PilA
VNTQFKVKLLSHLNKKNQNKGFTSIELLVVVIIVLLAAAIAIPNLTGQCCLPRKTEARKNLGALNSASREYRSEKGTFTTIARLPVSLTHSYYNFVDAATPTQTGMAFIAKPVPVYADDIRSHAAAVGRTSDGTFSSVICEAINFKDLAKAAPGTKNEPARCLEGSRLVQ